MNIQTVLHDRVTADILKAMAVDDHESGLVHYITISFGTVFLQCLGSEGAQAAPNSTPSGRLSLVVFPSDPICFFKCLFDVFPRQN